MDYLLKAKEIIATNLKIPVDSIADDGTLNDLGQIDSIAFEATILAIEAVLGHRIDAVALLDMRSVRDVANILKQG
ncbi:MAG: acyl carrier protein [Saezia sp.]